MGRLLIARHSSLPTGFEIFLPLNGLRMILHTFFGRLLVCLTGVHISNIHFLSRRSVADMEIHQLRYFMALACAVDGGVTDARLQLWLARRYTTPVLAQHARRLNLGSSPNCGSRAFNPRKPELTPYRRDEHSARRHHIDAF